MVATSRIVHWHSLPPKQLVGIGSHVRIITKDKVFSSSARTPSWNSAQHLLKPQLFDYKYKRNGYPRSISIKLIIQNLNDKTSQVKKFRTMGYLQKNYENLSSNGKVYKIKPPQMLQIKLMTINTATKYIINCLFPLKGLGRNNKKITIKSISKLRCKYHNQFCSRPFYFS